MRVNEKYGSSAFHDEKKMMDLVDSVDKLNSTLCITSHLYTNINQEEIRILADMLYRIKYCIIKQRPIAYTDYIYLYRLTAKYESFESQTFSQSIQSYYLHSLSKESSACMNLLAKSRMTEPRLLQNYNRFFLQLSICFHLMSICESNQTKKKGRLDNASAYDSLCI